MGGSADFKFTDEQITERCKIILKYRDKAVADPNDSMARLDLGVWSWDVAAALAEFWREHHPND